MQVGSRETVVRSTVGGAVRCESAPSIVRSEVGGAVRSEVEPSARRFEVALAPAPTVDLPPGFRAEIVTFKGVPVTHNGQLVWALVPI